ncbi:MAG: preprotein translocase subunit SecG [bacterium]|nr:preprotein translocase subunit SecG [bacterium]
MITALKIFQALIAIGLIVAILMQSGRSMGLGVISGGAESIFGRKKSMDSFFSKLAIGLGIAFLVFSIVIAVVQ